MINRDIVLLYFSIKRDDMIVLRFYSCKYLLIYVYIEYIKNGYCIKTNN
jgi:hypothetical protein